MAPALLSWLWVWWPGCCWAFQDTRRSQKAGGKTAVQGELRTAVGEGERQGAWRRVGLGCWGGGQSQSHTRDPSNTLELCATPLGQNKPLKWGPEPRRHKTSPPIFADHLHEVTHLLLTVPTKVGHSKLEKAGLPSWGGEIPKTRLTSHLNLYLLFFP